MTEAVTEAAEKGRLAKGAEAKASLGAGVAHCVVSPGGAPAVGSPEKTVGRGVEVVPCADAGGTTGSEWDLTAAGAGGVEVGGV